MIALQYIIIKYLTQVHVICEEKVGFYFYENV